MRGNLTLAELEQSKSGPQFADVKPSQLFSKRADSVLASRVRRLNAARYWELKQLWEYETNTVKRPDGYYGE